MTSASTEEAARTLAEACGSVVSVSSLMDPWTSVVVEPTGEVHLSQSVYAERAADPDDVDSDGTPWRPVDATLLADPVDGRIRMVAPASDLSFSSGDVSGDGGPLASLTTSDGHTVTMDVPFDLPAPRVDIVAGQVVYEDVFPRVDVVVAPNADGSSYSEVIRAEDAAALEIPELAGLTGQGLVFPISMSDGLELVESGQGGFDVVETASGEAVVESAVPVTWDSAADAVLAPASEEASAGVAESTTGSKPTSDTGDVASEAVVAPDGEVIPLDEVDERRAEAPVAGDEIVTMESELVDAGGAGAGVSIRIDAAELAGMSGPVHVDPSTGEKTSPDSVVIQSAFPTSTHYNEATSFPMGVCTWEMGCPQTNLQRSAWQFNGMTGVAGLRSSDITRAEFTIFGSHTYSCATRNTELWRTRPISSSTNWNNFTESGDWIERLGTKDISHREACGTQRDITWDVTSAAEWMAANDRSYLTLGVKGDSSTDPATWKRYANPRFEVWYNRRPTVPTVSDMGLRSGGSEYGCKTSQSTRAVLRYKEDLQMVGVGRDPDAGDQVQVRFVVVDVATGDWVWESDWTDYRTKPFTFSRTVDAWRLAPETIYRWRFMTRDVGGRYTSYSEAPPCYFEIDGHSPESPDVYSALYPEDKFGGGSGQVGTFTFSVPKTPDVVRYEYSFDSEAMTRSVAAGTDGKASVTPAASVFTAGSHYLMVRAVDNSGRQSKVATTYRFNVRFASVDAYWHLDEGTGLTSADSSGLGNTLTIGSGAIWGIGPAESVMLSRIGDGALRFSGAADSYARSAGPVVHVDPQAGQEFHGFAVSAFVRADSTASANQVAVSQDGKMVSSFKLGRLASDRCAAGMTTCWGFSMYGTDENAGMDVSRAVSTRPVVAGEWVHLTGVYDADPDRKYMDLFVCPVGKPGQARPADWGEPVLASTVPYVGTQWGAGGPVQVGRGMYQGAHNDYWDGMIDDVRLYTNEVLDLNRIRAICNGDLT